MEKTERLSRTASVAYTKGLLNNPGENNCFLNSAVQVLWHLDVFRRSFRELSGHFCAGESCIFCALKVLFTQIQYSDEAALPPDALRQALAVTFKDQQRFQLQDMDDAAECLENILNRLHFHLAMNEKDEICNAAHCISHRKFAMEIMEQTICNCGETSEPLPFFQLVHYVSVSALCREADILSTKLRGLNQDMFGHLLKRTVNQGDTRECPGNCGKRISVQQSLLNCPDVVCIGLIWDSDNPDVEQISQLLDCIDTVLRLPEVFPRVSDDKAKKVELLLAGVVTYYGKHYSTFFYSNKMKTWIYFDDARVRKCGPDWEKIRYKCYQNHYQPLLLLYVNPHGRPVSTKSAPAEVKLVDTETLLASGESARNRGSISSEKAMDIIGGTPSAVSEPNRKSKSVESVDGLLSSSSSHSVGSIRYSEKETQGSSPDRKKNKRSIKRLKIIGTDIVKKALSRSRPNSPTPELRNSTNSLDALGSEKVQAPKKFNSDEDLIDLSSDVRSKNIMSLYEHSTRGHEVDETDSGLGSGGSQASSPATSSVSSVDTNTDDLIDFTTRTFPRTAKGNENHRLDGMVEEAESLLRRSYDIEKTGDLALSLSLCTNASTRFRIAIEKCSAAQYPAYLASLKNKHNLCLERSRKLHQQITAEKETSGPQFTRQEKQQLLMRQRERDQQVIRQLKQTPTVQGTLPRSTTKGRNGGVQFNGVAPMSIKSVSEVPLSNYCGMDGSNLPATARRPSSRSHYPGSVGTCRTPDDESRDKVNCSQKIKPDMLCYSPVHYGKPDGLSSDFERLKVNREGSRQDRIPTVTHVSTSFIPLKNLPIERTLSTSAAYRSPNSRTALNDARRFSIYDNMPPRDDYRKTPAVPPRRTASPSPSCPANTSLIRVFNQENEERARSTDTPPYVDPPPYHRTRTYQSTTTSENQPSTLLQRFNVPSPSKSLESVGLPDDIRRINEELLAARPLCQRCHGVPVEKSKTMCTPCQALDSMLHDLNGDTAALY